MANTKSAKKAFRASERKKEVNNSRKNRIRTFTRKVKDAIEQKDQSKANEALKALEPEIMKGVTKKVVKLNTAARRLSRLHAEVKKIKK